MVEGLARILVIQQVKAERVGAITRLALVTGLAILQAYLLRPLDWAGPAGLRLATTFVLLNGYSIYLLIALGRGVHPQGLGYVSVVLDATGAALLLYGLLAAPRPAPAGILLSAAYFFVALPRSSLRL